MTNKKIVMALIKKSQLYFFTKPYFFRKITKATAGKTILKLQRFLADYLAQQTGMETFC